ncbi:MAG: hypothetical protein RQ899_14965, partial [Pseudomonadales bacterium]|nr:hypothetical protein [Pseudomonadales bacterium]
LVVAIDYEDHALRYTTYETLDGAVQHVPVEYPYTLGQLEIFRIVDGRISRIEGLSAFLPYYMPRP